MTQAVTMHPGRHWRLLSSTQRPQAGQLVDAVAVFKLASGLHTPLAAPAQRRQAATAAAPAGHIGYSGQAVIGAGA